ncbi:unnamed protein product [Rotaria sp. Silwood2]|nr:unnamed protein product [Rotaria sp. Silwood2]
MLIYVKHHMIFDEVLMNKDDFLTSLTQLVTYITHSMRGWLRMILKKKYIRSMINIAASWGGAIKALRLMASDDNIDVKWSHVRHL